MKIFSKKAKQSIIVLVMIFAIVVTLFSCKQEPSTPKTYTISYNANGATDGDAPASGTKTHDVVYTLATNSGLLAKTGFIFDGWNTKEDGSGTSYAAGATYSANENLALYAKWTAIYTISYNANGATDGDAPASGTKTHDVNYTLATNSGNLTKTDYSFGGWNTEADGTGKVYKPGETYSTNATLTLYARWIAPINMKTVLSTQTAIKGSDTSDKPDVLKDRVFRTGRNVTLSAYEIGQYEVTQELFEQVMGFNPSHFSSNPYESDIQSKRPVETVTWYDAVYFCNELTKLNMTKGDCVYSITDIVRVEQDNPESSITSATVSQDLSKKGYRLPTEAEWECAARGGEPSNATNWSYPYSGSGTYDVVAWHSIDHHDSHFSYSKTHQVGKLNPNDKQLFDMTGNVLEWCWDWYTNSIDTGNVENPTGPSSGTNRIRRGGCWESTHVDQLKVFNRGASWEPYQLEKDTGFRLCRTK